MQETQGSTWQQRFKQRAGIVGFFVTVFWVVEIADQVMFNGSLDRWGIAPRNLDGLRGILFAPFLHGGFAHLLANTVPFVVLGWLVLLFGTGAFFFVFLSSAVVGGLGTWLIGGSGTMHIGASGVVFGLMSFLLVRGYFERNFKAIVLSFAVGILYGGLIFGVLPGQPGVSWQGHLFGFVGGIMAARLLPVKKRLPV